jgi:sortase B
MRNVFAYIGVALAVCACVVFGHEWMKRSEEVHAVEATQEIISKVVPVNVNSKHPYDAMHEAYPDVKGWLVVEGTSIAQPITQGTVEAPEKWLRRNLNGEYSLAGTCYMDARIQNYSHVMIYGHHMNDTGAMFTELANTYRQEKFDGIGNAVFTTANGTRTYKPVMAMEVYETHDLSQRFVFLDDEETREWLGEMLAEAEAKSVDAANQVANATEVLTLVTCTKPRIGQPWRTLTVFAR